MTDLALTVEERESLLSGLHTGVLAVAADNGDPPLATPIWYSHDSDGQITVVTARTSKKARLLAAAGRATFLVHEDQPPRHVAADVDVSIEPPDDAVRRRIAERYIPAEMVDAYLAGTADLDVVVVRLTPRRWLTIDLTKTNQST